LKDAEIKRAFSFIVVACDFCFAHVNSFIVVAVQDTKRSNGTVTNTFTTYNSSDVILYGIQHSNVTQNDLRIRIDDNEGFTSSFFNFTIVNLSWFINNRS